MALTITEKYRASIGGKAWRAYEITHDDSVTTVDASDLALDTIEFAMFSPGTQASAPAANLTMSVAADGSCLVFSEALKTDSVTPILVIGW